MSRGFGNAASGAGLVPIALLAAAMLLASPRPARAAPRVTIEVTPITFLQQGGPATSLVRVLMHLEARYEFGQTTLNLTLDPGGLLDLNGRGGTEWVWSVTEAFAQHRRGPLDLRIGIERLPLETARLMIPFSVEDVDVLGTRLGRPGVRVLWYPDAATRLRAALLDLDGVLAPALSLRRQFASSELEGHALSLSAGRTAFGLGGSGLVGRLVLYGEAWLLTGPAETRYAVGLSGSFPDGLWMVEAGHAAAAAVARLLPEAGVRPQAAGQVSYRLADDLTVTGTARVLADPDALRAQLTVQLTRTAGNTDYTLSLTTLLGPEPRRDIVMATISTSF